MKHKLILGCLLLCASTTFAAEPTELTRAVAKIHSLKDGKIIGEVWFESGPGDGLKINARLYNLPTSSEHGFHIHEFGDCTAADGKSAGGHYNPTSKQHGGPQSAERHAGDLGNIKTDEKGEASVTQVDKGPLVPLVGRSVVIHEKADDLKTDPSGNSGARIACGVIGLAEKSGS